MRTEHLASEWMQYRSAVWISDRWGIAARTADGRWFAYPFGGGELGPFPSLDDAKTTLEQRKRPRAESCD